MFSLFSFCFFILFLKLMLCIFICVKYRRFCHTMTTTTFLLLLYVTNINRFIFFLFDSFSRASSSVANEKHNIFTAFFFPLNLPARAKKRHTFAFRTLIQIHYVLQILHFFTSLFLFPLQLCFTFFFFRYTLAVSCVGFVTRLIL